MTVQSAVRVTKCIRFSEPVCRRILCLYPLNIAADHALPLSHPAYGAKATDRSYAPKCIRKMSINTQSGRLTRQLHAIDLEIHGLMPKKNQSTSMSTSRTDHVIRVESCVSGYVLKTPATTNRWAMSNCGHFLQSPQLTSVTLERYERPFAPKKKLFSPDTATTNHTLLAFSS